MPRPTNAQLNEADSLYSQGFQLCGSCEKTLPVTSFGKSRKGRFGLQRNCRDCTNRRSREKYYPKRDRERANLMTRQWRANLTDDERKLVNKRNNVKRQFGITVEEYDAYMAHPCAICGKESSHLDHCHDTGKIRGALCSTCNPGLGHFFDDPGLLRAAADYIERHRH